MIALIRQRFAEYRERQLLRHMFDELFYIAAYKDVARSGLNPFSHYVRHGRLEGRKPFSDETAQALYAEDGPRSEERRRLLRSLGCFSFAATGTLISSSDGVGDPKPDEARQADPIAPRPSAFEQTIIA
jgi:hypothetical protein